MSLFEFFKRKERPRLFGGGCGDSFETAVIINIEDSMAGVDAEYAFVAVHCGVTHKDWTMRSQSLQEHGGKPYDVLTITLSDGGTRTFYFDIAKFFGN